MSWIREQMPEVLVLSDTFPMLGRGQREISANRLTASFGKAVVLSLSDDV